MFHHSKSLLPGQPLIEMRDVSKRFILRHESNRSIQESFIRLVQHGREPRRYFWPLKDVSFAVHQGDSLGIVGPNGSGKSTLLKLITGILEPTSGEISTNGRISSLLELGAGFHPDLTGRENIFLNGSMFGLSRRQMLRLQDSIIDFAELDEFIDVPIKHYSSGMYVRLGFAVAIHTQPDMLLVDEVLAVGDAAFQHKCMDRIQEFRERGGTLLLVSHDLGTIQSLCKQALWLDHGCVRSYGNPTDVVMEYLNQVAQEEEAGTAARSRAPSMAHNSDHRWGTGKVQITRVEICDETGAERSLFYTGCPMDIRLHYHAEQRVADPIFGLGIYHQNGAHVTGPNSGFDDVPIPFVEGDGQVVFHIPALALLEGAYSVSVSSHNREDTEMYAYHDRRYAFRVYPGESRERYGLVTLNGSWSVDPPCQPASVLQAAGVSLPEWHGRG